jgi:FtsZ-interacting cell division protein ZipA
MIETANCVVKNLDADLLDEDHQLMTEEALQALRDRVNVACLS